LYPVNRHKVMKNSLALLVVGLLLLGSTFPRDVYIDERTSTEVFFAITEKVFPGHWYGERINAEVEPLSRTERQRMILILQRAFAKYPDQILRDNLDRVYLFKTMKFYGVMYGGTNASNNIYMSDDEYNPLFSDLFIENVFHHEFSSILKRSYPRRFKTAEWENINPSRFVYGNGGVDAMLHGEASMSLDPELFASGFLSKYSQASVEEDVNVFAQNIFTGSREFWKIVDQNVRIRKKADLLIAFYHSIHPTFTEEYFRGISEKIARR
jgi:hypothetical protein